MSQHTEQIASVIRREIQNQLTRGLNDPRIRGMISVTSVEVSADLARGTVSVSVHPAKYEPLTLKGLQAAGKHIRRAVASRIRIRRMPQLEFRIDATMKKQAAFEKALHEGEFDEDISVSHPQESAPVPESTITPESTDSNNEEFLA